MSFVFAVFILISENSNLFNISTCVYGSKEIIKIYDKAGLPFTDETE